MRLLEIDKYQCVLIIYKFHVENRNMTNQAANTAAAASTTLLQVWIALAAVVNYQSFGMEIILDQSRLSIRLRQPIILRICVVGVAQKRSAAEWCILPLLPAARREFGWEGAGWWGEYHWWERDYFNTHWRTITLIYWVPINSREGFLHLLRAVSWAEKSGLLILYKDLVRWRLATVLTVTVS